jgi:hypothetical protein
VTVVLDIGIVLLCLATLTGAVFLLQAGSAGFRERWRRIGPARVRRALIGGALAAGLLLTEATLLIAEPWGHRTILYVTVFGGGALMLLTLTATAVEAVEHARRTRRRRAAEGSQGA